MRKRKMKFKDLEFQPHKLRTALTVGDEGFGLYDNHTQAIWEENDAKLSIVYDGNTYEVLLLELDGEKVSSMPIGSMSKRQLVIFINKVCTDDT